MADNTTRTQVTKENTEFYDRTLLERVIPLFIHGMFAQVRNLPMKAGTNRIRFRRYSNLAAATTPLSEGVTPAGKQLAITNVEADVSQYGDFVTVTDVVSYESKDPVLTETAELLGDQAGDTLDQLTRDVLAASTAVIYSGSGNTQNSEVATADVITTANVKTAVLALKLQNAKKITGMVDPSDGVGTTPLNAAYIAFVHPNISETVRAFDGFVEVEKYPSNRKAIEGEIGYYNEVRFIETTNAKVHTGEGTSNIDVYSTIILAKHAYGITRVSGKAMENIIHPLGSAGSADPLNQRQTSGWKSTFVAKILNNAFMQRIVSAAV